MVDDKRLDVVGCDVKVAVEAEVEEKRAGCLGGAWLYE
jgi:hypothetical protein